jgi:hypothetical protein
MIRSAMTVVAGAIGGLGFFLIMSRFAGDAAYETVPIILMTAGALISAMLLSSLVRALLD